jgi:hypothetical protein
MEDLMKYIDPKLLIIVVLIYIIALAMLFTIPYCIVILGQLFSVETIFLSLIQSVLIAGLNVLVYEGIVKNVKGAYTMPNRDVGEQKEWGGIYV